MNIEELYRINKLKDPRNQSFNKMPIVDKGWFDCNHKPEFYDKLIVERNVKSVLEIGSWLGQSTKFFADRVDFVIAIDTWEGSEEHKNGKEGKDHIENLSLLWDQFRSNTDEYKNIYPIRMSSKVAHYLKLPKVDLIFVDGAHDYISVYTDVNNYQKFLSEDGCMCGDDIQEKDVQKALIDWCNKNNMGFKVNYQWRIVDPKKEKIERKNVHVLGIK